MQAFAFINTPLKVYLNHIRLTSMLCIYMLPVIKPFIYTQTYTMSPLCDTSLLGEKKKSYFMT